MQYAIPIPVFHMDHDPHTTKHAHTCDASFFCRARFTNSRRVDDEEKTKCTFTSEHNYWLVVEFAFANIYLHAHLYRVCMERNTQNLT